VIPVSEQCDDATYLGSGPEAGLQSNYSAGDVFPTDCVLCDYSGESNEDYEEHMQEVHD
jgi:hypothetical protein